MFIYVSRRLPTASVETEMIRIALLPPFQPSPLPSISPLSFPSLSNLFLLLFFFPLLFLGLVARGPNWFCNRRRYSPFPPFLSFSLPVLLIGPGQLALFSSDHPNPVGYGNKFGERRGKSARTAAGRTTHCGRIWATFSSEWCRTGAKSDHSTLSGVEKMDISETVEKSRFSSRDEEIM